MTSRPYPVPLPLRTPSIYSSSIFWSKFHYFFNFRFYVIFTLPTWPWWRVLTSCSSSGTSNLRAWDARSRGERARPPSSFPCPLKLVQVRPSVGTSKRNLSNHDRSTFFKEHTRLGKTIGQNIKKLYCLNNLI